MRKAMSCQDLPNIQEYRSIQPRNLSFISDQLGQNVDYDKLKSYILNNQTSSATSIKGEPQSFKELPSIFNTRKVMQSVEKCKRTSIIDRNFEINKNSFVHTNKYKINKPSIVSHISNLKNLKIQMKWNKSDLSQIIENTPTQTMSSKPSIDKFEQCLFQSHDKKGHHRTSNSTTLQNSTLASAEDKQLYSWNFTKKDIAEKYKYSVCPKDENNLLSNNDAKLENQKLERQCLKMRLIINKNHVNFIFPNVKAHTKRISPLKQATPKLENPVKQCTNELLRNLIERYPQYVPEKKEKVQLRMKKEASGFKRQTTFSMYQEQIQQISQRLL